MAKVLRRESNAAADYSDTHKDFMGEGYLGRAVVNKSADAY